MMKIWQNFVVDYGNEGVAIVPFYFAKNLRLLLFVGGVEGSTFGLACELDSIGIPNRILFNILL